MRDESPGELWVLLVRSHAWAFYRRGSIKQQASWPRISNRIESNREGSSRDWICLSAISKRKLRYRNPAIHLECWCSLNLSAKEVLHAWPNHITQRPANPGEKIPILLSHCFQQSGAHQYQLQCIRTLRLRLAAFVGSRPICPSVKIVLRY